jgi:hypothetical protein
MNEIPAQEINSNLVTLAAAAVFISIWFGMLMFIQLDRARKLILRQCDAMNALNREMLLLVKDINEAKAAEAEATKN